MFRALGRMVGKALAALGIRAVRSVTNTEPEVKTEVTTSDAAKVGVVILALCLFSCASAVKEFGIGVVEGARDCLKDTAGCVPPRPTPTPTPIVTPVPTEAPCPEGTARFCQPSSGQCWCLPLPGATNTPVVTPTVTVTPAPTVAPTATPDPTPQCVEPPPAPPTPVSLAYPGRTCPRGFEELAFDASSRFGPPGHVLCAVKSECEHDGHSACFGLRDRPRWRLGYDMNQGHNTLRKYRDKWLAYDEGRGCKDAYGRSVSGDDCSQIYPHGDPWGHADMAEPFKCPEATPTPAPTPIGTPVVGCAVVEGLEHWMAPGDHCHKFELEMGRIRCQVDSTIRPICDFPDHAENWNSICGQRTHDPNYESADYAQAWTISGAEDLGPDRKNSAQRWIIGEPGEEVMVTVCIRPDAVTPDGCRITRRGDGCGSRMFRLPTGFE